MNRDRDVGKGVRDRDMEWNRDREEEREEDRGGDRG